MSEQQQVQQYKREYQIAYHRQPRPREVAAYRQQITQVRRREVQYPSRQLRAHLGELEEEAHEAEIARQVSIQREEERPRLTEEQRRTRFYFTRDVGKFWRLEEQITEPYPMTAEKYEEIFGVPIELEKGADIGKVRVSPQAIQVYVRTAETKAREEIWPSYQPIADWLHHVREISYSRMVDWSAAKYEEEYRKSVTIAEPVTLSDIITIVGAAFNIYGIARASYTLAQPYISELWIGSKPEMWLIRHSERYAERAAQTLTPMAVSTHYGTPYSVAERVAQEEAISWTFTTPKTTLLGVGQITRAATLTQPSVSSLPLLFSVGGVTALYTAPLSFVEGKPLTEGTFYRSPQKYDLGAFLKREISGSTTLLKLATTPGRALISTPQFIYETTKTTAYALPSLLMSALGLGTRAISGGRVSYGLPTPQEFKIPTPSYPIEPVTPRPFSFPITPTLLEPKRKTEERRKLFFPTLPKIATSPFLEPSFKPFAETSMKPFQAAKPIIKQTTKQVSKQSQAIKQATINLQRQLTLRIPKPTEYPFPKPKKRKVKKKGRGYGWTFRIHPVAEPEDILKSLMKDVGVKK